MVDWEMGYIYGMFFLFLVAIVALVAMVTTFGVPSASTNLLVGSATFSEYLSPIDPDTGLVYFDVETDGPTPSGSLPLTANVYTDGTRIFYEKFYVSTKNDEWEPYELGDAQQGWVLVDSSEDVIHPASLVGDEAYVIVFSCKAVNGEWECGCDANGNCNKWTLVDLSGSTMYGCTDDTGCSGSNLCDTSSGECVECLDDTDCSGTDVCVAGDCVPPGTTCQESKACNGLEIVKTHTDCSTEKVAVCNTGCQSGLCTVVTS